MSRGNSGRVVIEIDPTIKDELYVALVKDKLTLKDWFLAQCSTYLENQHQSSLFVETKLEKAITGKPHE